MTDAERFRKFNTDFAQLRRNREQVPLEQLQTRFAKAYNALIAEVQTGADWFADACMKRLIDRFPRHPDDHAGNEWLDRRLAAIRTEEEQPGGRVERYRTALLERLDRKEYERLVWEICNRLEREAFNPYWLRHSKRLDSGWIWNDILRKFWFLPESGKPGGWINSDYSGWDGRFPPQI